MLILFFDPYYQEAWNVFSCAEPENSISGSWKPFLAISTGQMDLPWETIETLPQHFPNTYSLSLKHRKIVIYIAVSGECSGSVVECLTRDGGAAGASLTGVTALCPWAKHINPSLVLVQPRKTRLFITDRLLMGRKESNQSKQLFQNIFNEIEILKRIFISIF